MSNFWESDSFKKLQQKWYEKLKKSGFDDAERVVGDELKLKQRATNAYVQAPRVVRQAKLDYYRALCEYVHREKFKNEADELIMLRRSEGITIKQISKELKKLGFKHHRQTIRYVIRKYEHRWNIKKWSLDKLTSKR